jgi:hypothetical protein
MELNPKRSTNIRCLTPVLVIFDRIDDLRFTVF